MNKKLGHEKTKSCADLDIILGLPRESDPLTQSSKKCAIKVQQLP